MTEQVIIRQASKMDSGLWDQYVLSHPQSTVFHHWCWSEIVQDIHGHAPYFLIAESGGKIAGLLPLAHNKTILFGNSLTGLPFCPYGGPIADNDDIALALCDHALALSKSIGATQLELRLLRPLIADAPTQNIYYTFRRAISADHTTNMDAIPRKQRAMVRKGIKNELVAEVGTVDQFYELYLDNIHRHGTPGSPKAFFAAMQKHFGKDCEILIVKSKTGELLTGVLSLFFKEEVLPFYAGDYPAARDLAANDFKYWAVMQRAADRGARLFDFGRSKSGTGPYSFKKNWGFEPLQLHYQYLGLEGRPIPENNPLNPKYRLMIATWRKLPKPLVSWLGPQVVKGLG